MAPRKKAAASGRKTPSDVPRTRAAAEKLQARTTRANGHDTRSGDDLANGHEIAVLAYELFIQRGGEHGHDLEDWLAAERQLANREG